MQRERYFIKATRGKQNITKTTAAHPQPENKAFQPQHSGTVK